MKKLLTGVVATGIVAASVLGISQTADATEASVSQSDHCISNGLWEVDVTLTNKWDGTTNFTILSAEGPLSPTLTGRTSQTFAIKTSKDNLVVRVTSNHPEHLTGDTNVPHNRPDGCTVEVPPTYVPPPSQAPPTTDLPRQPVNTPPSTETPVIPEPPTVATTDKVCENGQPPSIEVEDHTFVCPEFGGPPVVVKQGPPKKKIELPTTK